MDITEAIRRRKSIRGFKPAPVPREVIRDVLALSAEAPSAMNTQPWEITVVAGKILDKMRESNIERFQSGAKPYPDSQSKPYEGVYRQRQVELAIQIFQLMGIAREDKEKRAAWMQRGLRFFDAPAAVIIAVDKSLSQSAVMIDIGSFAQTFCLAALGYGLGTCIHDQGLMYPDVIRSIAGIPGSKRLIMCMSLGYPDWDFPANKLESKREPVDDFASWPGLD
jgi:nitroreductase